MSILPQLERDLLKAAERQHSPGGQDKALSRQRSGSHRRRRTLRLALLIAAATLTATTIALAATGVILTGSPVRPEEQLNPNVGEGLPATGGSVLLPLRIADPEGGPPWGMRIVRTTRGEICVQVGRVQNDQLGELGLDGAFRNDGRFHPLPVDALPADAIHGQNFAAWGLANANTSCHLIGEAATGAHIGLDRSAAPDPTAAVRPFVDLRNVYYGTLGPNAVSISYTQAGKRSSQTVVPGIGAYLLVQPSKPGRQISSGSEDLGSEGDLTPSAPLTSITYQLDGKLCQRGPSEPPGVISHLSAECPWPRYSKAPAAAPEPHEQLHVRTQVTGHRVTGIVLSFTAPYAVTSASSDYEIQIPSGSCGPPGSSSREGTGYSESTIGRNVASGETIEKNLSARELFFGYCGETNAQGHLIIKAVPRHSVTIDVRYSHKGYAPVLIGSITVHAPAGTP